MNKYSISARIASAILFTTLVSCTDRTPVYNLENDAVQAFMQFGPYESFGCRESYFKDKELFPQLPGNDDPRFVNLTWKGSGDAVYDVVVAADKDFDEIVCETRVQGPAVQIPNLIPQRKYWYKVIQDGRDVVSAAFRTEGQVRMIAVDQSFNMRDLGGWEGIRGHRIRYGALYRSGSLNGEYSGITSEVCTGTSSCKNPVHEAAQTQVGNPDYYSISAETIAQVRNVGIKAELDLRGLTGEGVWGGECVGHSRSLGFTQIPGLIFTHITTDMGLITPFEDPSLVKDVKWIIDQLRNDHPVVFHCRSGADRTGALAFLIEALLGVRSGDIARDYELTCLSSEGKGQIREAYGVCRHGYGFFSKGLGEIEVSDTLATSKLQRQAYKYLNDCFEDCRICAEDLDWFINYMLEADFAQEIRPSWAYSRPSVEYLRENPVRAGIQLYPYEFHEIVDTPAPAGYKAFYASHYGRHGSRSDSGANRYQELADALAAAEQADLLTDAGKAVLAEVQEVLRRHDGMDGRLTALGRKEHAKIAERLYKRCPGIFEGDKSIRSVSSTVPRCLISQNSFTNSLMSLNPRLNISLDSGEKIMHMLASIGGNELQKEIRAVSDPMITEFRNANICSDTLAFAQAVFTDLVAARAITPNFQKLRKNAFKVAMVSGVFEIKDVILQYIPFDYIYNEWRSDNRKVYMHHCNSALLGNTRISPSKECAADIANKADEAIAGGEYCADLRFGHDYPLLGLVGYIGVEGVGDRLEFDDIDENWHSFFDVPMASNLQFIFYRNSENDVLVKCLYQETERAIIGLEPVSGPYYKWDDVRARLLSGNFR